MLQTDIKILGEKRYVIPQTIFKYLFNFQIFKCSFYN